MMESKKPTFIRYNKDGELRESEISNTPTEFRDLYSNYHEEEGDDNCTVCNENLFFNRNITKRIAILEADKSVSGWICPSCYTEFDNADKVVVLMSKSQIQGRA